MNFKKEWEASKSDMLNDLQGLIRIPSIASEKEGDCPFGAEVQNALEYMLNLGSKMGFEVKNVDNYGGHIDFPGKGDGIMGIICHIDVVPEGEGWTHEAFGGEIEGKYIYGRGTQDDKGPTMVCLYAMKILKDMGFKPEKTIRLILGLDEEDAWEGMEYYLKHESTPDFGIVPDADFPMIQCEKGLYQFDIVRKWHENCDGNNETGIRIEKIRGGTAANVVAAKAEFTISGNETELEDTLDLLIEKAHDFGFEIRIPEGHAEGERTVEVTGKPAHAAYPEKGINAVSRAMKLLGFITPVNDEGKILTDFYNSKIAFSTTGEGLGCKMSDDLSGELTFNIGGIRFDEGESRITVDIRYPVTKTKDMITESVSRICGECGFLMEEQDHIKSIYQESDNRFVSTLLSIYQKVTGDTETMPTVIGGATFARAVPNCMAFGPLFPDDEELEHQKNEAASIDNLLKAGEIYTESIYELTKEQ